MSFAAFWLYYRTTLSNVTWIIWVALGIISFVASLLLIIRKKVTVYRAVAYGITLFVTLLLLVVTVLLRISDNTSYEFGFCLKSEYNRLIQGEIAYRIQMLSNILAFIPFGFFLFESLSTNQQNSSWLLIKNVVLFALGFSLCIECLQLILHVGLFELTDLLTNTLGAFIGAGIATLLQAVFAHKDNFANS